MENTKIKEDLKRILGVGAENYKGTFNAVKTDYSVASLFLGGDPGLINSINLGYGDMWKLYKIMRADMWDEKEFDLTPCNVDFKKCDEATYDMMIKTLAWQWEADSVASNSIYSIASLYQPADALAITWLNVSEGEAVHALTYSEIIRNSFDDPTEVINEILEVSESLERLETIDTVFANAKERGLQYALGLVPDDQETYNAIFKFVIALYYLERLQFIASFAVTFAIADTGIFQPIGKAVQRIAKDELESHAMIDQFIIRNELQTERGKLAYEQTKDEMEGVLNRVTQQECIWVDYLFSEGRELVGMTPALLKQWVGFNAKHVYNFMGYTPSTATLEAVGSELPTVNPLPYMVKWLDMSKMQPSPQEEVHSQYKHNVVVSDDTGAVFSDDF